MKKGQRCLGSGAGTWWAAVWGELLPKLFRTEALPMARHLDMLCRGCRLPGPAQQQHGQQSPQWQHIQRGCATFSCMPEHLTTWYLSYPDIHKFLWQTLWHGWTEWGQLELQKAVASFQLRVWKLPAERHMLKNSCRSWHLQLDFKRIWLFPTALVATTWKWNNRTTEQICHLSMWHWAFTFFLCPGPCFPPFFYYNEAFACFAVGI